jgi:formylmethanofuran dehydrogenase subunit B
MNFLSVACPFCSLHCDDLHLHYDGGHWVLISPTCPLATRKYKDWDPITAGPSNPVQEAVKILNKAQQPLILLTGSMEQEVVLSAVNLARATSAYLVRDSSYAENISSAIQKAGLLSCTLADLPEPTDQVVILGDDPHGTLPRFWEFVGNNKKEKVVWVQTQNIFESIQGLRLQNKGLKTSFSKEIEGAASRIAKANSGVVFANAGSISENENALTEVLLWMKELGDLKKWYGQVLPSSSNELGISQGMRSATGYSDGMIFRKRKIYHDPRSFQIEKIIEYHELDALVIIGDADHLPRHILQKMEGLTTVILSPEKPSFQTDVWLPCPRAGIDAQGTMLRLDGIPIKLESLVRSGRTLIQNSLAQLIQGIIK